MSARAEQERRRGAGAPLVLGIDIGSTTTKAALVPVQGPIRAVHVAQRPTPADVPALLRSVAAVVRECAAAAGGPVAAVGIASMAEGGAALDPQDAPLTGVLRWDRAMDRSHLHALLARHPDLAARTGVPATTKPAAVVLSALRAEQPDVFARMARWAGVADLVAHELTGGWATDRTLAARTMLAHADGSGWDAGMLATVGIDEPALSAIRAPGEAAGETRATGGLGLPPGIPVHVVGHDHAVGAWAAGARRPGQAVDSLGTAEAVVRIADSPDRPRAVASGFAIGRTVDAAAATVLGGSPACGAMFAWWDAAHPKDRALQRLSALAPEDWADSPVLVLPFPAGRQCPSPDPGAEIRILHDDGDPLRRASGLLQSLVAHARWVREGTDVHAGTPTQELTLIGSLAARVPAWAPLAAASGVPTYRCTAEEPVAMGAALLAGVRSGALDPKAAVLPRIEVAPLRSTASDDIYRRYVNAVITGGEQ